MAVVNYWKIYFFHCEQFVFPGIQKLQIMKTLTRLVFGFNCLYQLAAGLACLLFPATVIAFYGGPAEPDVFLSSGFRAYGSCILFAAVISAYITANPDRYPILLRMMGILAMLTLAGWGTVYFKNELPLSALIFDIIVQLVIVVVVIAYHPHPVSSKAPLEHIVPA